MTRVLYTKSLRASRVLRNNQVSHCNMKSTEVQTLGARVSKRMRWYILVLYVHTGVQSLTWWGQSRPGRHDSLPWHQGSVSDYWEQGGSGCGLDLRCQYNGKAWVAIHITTNHFFKRWYWRILVVHIHLFVTTDVLPFHINPTTFLFRRTLEGREVVWLQIQDSRVPGHCLI